jgi:hypothetical protein
MVGAGLAAVVEKPAARTQVFWPAVLVVAPLAMAFGLSLIVIAGWAVGVHPFWPEPEVTLSEAAATRDAGELYRLLVYERRDPNRTWPVRAGMLADAEQQVMPLDVAVASGRPEIVRILLEHGARPDAAGRAALICRAATVGQPEVVDLLLATGDRSDPRAACTVSSN